MTYTVSSGTLNPTQQPLCGCYIMQITTVIQSDMALDCQGSYTAVVSGLTLPEASI